MELKEGEKVKISVGASTEIGFSVTVNGEFQGMIYHNEIFTPVEEGETLDAYVKKVREDGRIDVSLNPQGFQNVIDSNMKMIEDAIRKNNGVLKLSDKSSP